MLRKKCAYLTTNSNKFKLFSLAKFFTATWNLVTELNIEIPEGMVGELVICSDLPIFYQLLSYFSFISL